MRWIRLRFVLYALILAFLAVKFLGGTEDTGGAEVEVEHLYGQPQNASGAVQLSISDGRVLRADFQLTLACEDGPLWWRWSIGTAQLEQRGSRFSARTFDHSPRGESPPWQFNGVLSGRVTDGGERAAGLVDMTLSYADPGGRTRVCDTDGEDEWEASVR